MLIGQVNPQNKSAAHRRVALKVGHSGGGRMGHQTSKVYLGVLGSMMGGLKEICGERIRMAK